MKKVIIVQGGGFMTSYTTGVLDAFQMTNYKPFDAHIGISGGSIALSYFLSDQYSSCYKTMIKLIKERQFLRYSKVLTDGLLNLDYFHEIANKEMPFDFDKAEKNTQEKDFYVVLTNSDNGTPVYFQPEKKNWVDSIIASSTIPFLTKGKHVIDGVGYSDGALGDPIPVRWAVENGAKEVLVIRTTPFLEKAGKKISEVFASKITNASQKLKTQIENHTINVHKAISYMENPPKGVIIKQIAPANILKSGVFAISSNQLTEDYRHGLQCGLDHVFKNRSN